MLKFEPAKRALGCIDMSSFKIWLNDLLRPAVTYISVIVYEKGLEKDIHLYQDQYLESLVKAIDTLWSVEKESPFWFETEVYERRPCFQKPRTEIRLTCYNRDFTANGFKTTLPIPIRYRKKFFDKTHVLVPQPVGVKTWPPLEVKFVIPHT